VSQPKNDAESMRVQLTRIQGNLKLIILALPQMKGQNLMSQPKTHFAAEAIV